MREQRKLLMKLRASTCPEHGQSGLRSRERGRGGNFGLDVFSRTPYVPGTMGKYQPPKFNARVRAKYLEHLALTGRKVESAKVAGVDPSTISNHRKTDPDLLADEEAAMEAYRELIEAEIDRRGRMGWEQPVFGKDGQIGSKTMYSDRMLELHAKRHIPAYRDHNTIDHNVKGGVLVVPGLAQTSQEWEHEQGSG